LGNYLIQFGVKKKKIFLRMNTFGRLFRTHIFGESHGSLVGICLDGVPAGLFLSENDFDADLSRRKPGKVGTTPRKEADKPTLSSGVFNGRTTGAPITVMFANENTISADYGNLVASPRPGHSDFVAKEKFKGFNDNRGGGHFSGRLTLALVAAGVVAKKILEEVKINAELISAGGSINIDEAVNRAVETGDSIGGVVECRVQNLPVGLGEPFFDSAESVLSHLAFSIPAIKGIEFGSGFAAASMTGSQHNDPIVDSTGKTKTNNAGGINGGITNGNELVFRIAVKPTSSISVKQETFNYKTQKVEALEVKGRHDACIALRVPVVLEAITAIALADLLLIDKAYG
jgi:chorismate synthase